MFPNEPDEDIVEKLSLFFNKISTEYTPLRDEEIPVSYSKNLPALTHEQVRRRMLKMSKPTSTVPGDLPPILYKHYANLIAGPVVSIFNSAIRHAEWPALWSVEYVSVIPRVTSPESVDQCRNIACTNFLSKVLESFVLDWIREEVKLSSKQYGGEPGCGPAHFLLQMNEFIHSSLEDNRAGVVMTSMNFSKAFNRLSHLTCLTELNKKGASTDMMKLVSCFLRGRKMSVRLGGTSSKFRPVNAGAPQGSVLGCFLFNVGIDTLQDGCTYCNTTATPPKLEHHNHDQDFPASSTPTRARPSEDPPPQSPICSAESRFEILPRVPNIPLWIRRPKDPHWKEREPLQLNYVDDGAHLTKVNMKKEDLLVDNGVSMRIVNDPKS